MICKIYYITFFHFNRKLLLTTLTLLIAIAAPAIIGLSKKPLIGYKIPAKIAANKKNGHNLTLSAIVPDTIDTVVAQKTIWKYQSEPSE